MSKSKKFRTLRADLKPSNLKKKKIGEIIAFKTTSPEVLKFGVEIIDTEANIIIAKPLKGSSETRFVFMIGHSDDKERNHTTVIMYD